MTDFIKKFWDSQAVKFGQSASASWSDELAIDLEVGAIYPHIKDGDKVLDVGCANGHATFKQAFLHDINITGVDYSETMIEEAQKAKRDSIMKDKCIFQVADIKSLPFKDEEFDVTYTTRVLINLPTWEEQIIGIEECIRVTKIGGIVILSEGFYEPLQKLNALRSVCDLQPLEEHDFNRYIKKYKLEDFLNHYGIDFSCDDFSSMYYLGSRFVRELVTKIDQYPGYSNPVNKSFYDLEKKYSGGGFGIQQAYIIKK